MMTWVALLVAGAWPVAASLEKRPAQVTRAHVGLVATIAVQSCRRWRGHPVRFDFVRADTGKSVGEARFSTDGRKPLELAQGRYDVRLYVRYKGGYSYYDTEPIAVSEDGWVMAFGCQRGSDKPSLWFE